MGHRNHQQLNSYSLNVKIMKTLRIAIIIGSTRPGRNGEAVAKWVHEIAKMRSDAEFELVDIKDFNLPLLDEPVPSIMGQYSKPHTKTWAAKIGSFDGYVFVTPEYNHGISGALKNAIDFLFGEWNNKAAGFVSYGGGGGARAVEQLRLVLAEVQIVHKGQYFPLVDPQAVQQVLGWALFDPPALFGLACCAHRQRIGCESFH